MKILITGGAGFIGSHIVDELVKDNKVIVLDDLSGGFFKNVNEKAMFIEGSILDVDLLKNIFNLYKFDYVFHLAAYAAEGLSHFIKRFNYENNLIGSINLINESILNKVKCFVFTSFMAVYGKNQLPLKEDMTPFPEDPYGIAKLAVEKELEISKDMFGLDYIIFRPHNVYGERQNIADRYRNVIGIFMNQIMQNKPMTVFGDGRQMRAFSYISDVAPIIADAIHNPSAYGEVFNIGAERPYSILTLARTVAQTMKVKYSIEHLDPRNEVKYAFCDHTKLKKVFGENKAIPLEEGLIRMVKWAKEIGPKKSKKFVDIEIEQNLPKGWVGNEVG